MAYLELSWRRLRRITSTMYATTMKKLRLALKVRSGS